MRGETGLVIVGGADDQLRVSKHKKKAEAITQSMVDRCVVDDVREFLNSVLGAPLHSYLTSAYAVSADVHTPASTSRRGGGAGSRRRKASANKDGSPTPKRRAKSEPARVTNTLNKMSLRNVSKRVSVQGFSDAAFALDSAVASANQHGRRSRSLR